MIHEFRRYRIKPGAMGAYLEAFETFALPAVEKHMKLLCFWTSDTGELSHVFHLWQFDDHVHREESYARMRAEPSYRDEFVPVALPLVEAMHSQILHPVSFADQLPLIGQH